MNFKEYIQSLNESTKNIEKILSKIFKSSDDYEIDDTDDIAEVQIFLDKNNISALKPLLDTFVISLDDLYFDDATDEFVLEFDDSNPRDGQNAEFKYTIYFSDLADIEVDKLPLKTVAKNLQNNFDAGIIDDSTKSLLKSVRELFGGIDEDSAKIIIGRIAENS